MPMVLDEALQALRAAGKVATEEGKKRFSSLMSSAAPHALENPGLIREFPAGQLALPDHVFDITQTPSKLSLYPEQMKNTVLGQYDHLRNEITYNQFSNLFDHPGYSGEATGTAAHEYGHALQGQPDKLIGTQYESTVKPGAEILGINKFLRGPQDKDIRSQLFSVQGKQVDEDVLNKALYGVNPLETSMSRMSSAAQDAAGKPELLKAFRASYPSAYSLFNQEALDEFKTKYPRAAQIALKYAKDYLPVAAPVAVGLGTIASSADASQNVSRSILGSESNQESSKVDLSGSGEKMAPTTFAANVPLGDPTKVAEDWFKVGKALSVPAVRAWELAKDIYKQAKEGVEGASEIGGALRSNEAAKKYMETHSFEDITKPFVDLAMTSMMVPGKAEGVGALQMKGFYSQLTDAFAKSAVGKRVLSERMTGDQVAKTLLSGGIKEDELFFTGVGKELAAIGEERVGAERMAALGKMAEENALGFSRKDSPGTYSNFSLFSEGDPSFKNAVYSYPGVEFEEGHFGKGVIAHRRFGDKEIYSAESLPKLTADESSSLAAFRERNGYTPIWYDDILKNTNIPVKNSLLLDEVQSQFHEKGSRFGYGAEKNGLDTSITESLSGKSNYDKFHDAYLKQRGLREGEVPFAMQNDMTLYEKANNAAEKSDRSTPNGFATALKAESDAEKVYNKYNPVGSQSVENIPLRGEKYVELLAKDHLRDALASGKDAISWTSSEVQHERYYGKGGLGDVKWEFNVNDPRGKALEHFNKLENYTGLRFDNFDDAAVWASKHMANTDADNLSMREYAVYKAAADIRDLSVTGKDYKVESGLSFKLPNGMAKVAQSFGDLQKNVGSAATKDILEKLSAGETSGMVEGNAKEVYQKLYDRAIPKAFEKLTGEKPREGFVEGRNGEDVKIQWIPLDKVKEKMVKQVPVINPDGKITIGNKVKDLPIAHSQEVQNFFNPREAQQVNV